LGPVELDLLGVDAVGIGESVLDRHAHVGWSELCEDGAVDEFDEGVDDGLGMNDDVDLIGTQVEEPARFDDFEAFVHQGGGIDGDAVAHFPVGMGESLLDGDVSELRERRFAEGATGSGEDDAADFWEKNVGRDLCVVTRGRRRDFSLRRLRSERGIILNVQ
jgi:hypothetical protein